MHFYMAYSRTAPKGNSCVGVTIAQIVCWRVTASTVLYSYHMPQEPGRSAKASFFKKQHEQNSQVLVF